MQGYWIGVSREAPGAAWASFDELPLSQVAANMPYSHWGWSFAGDALTAGASCGLASSSLAYDFYNGDRSAASQANHDSYNLNTTDAVYGWTAAPCSSLQQFVCEVPASAYPCAPPPSPPTLPPRPPSPPAGAVSNKCKTPGAVCVSRLPAQCSCRSLAQHVS
jgi:hypothetical protein